MDAVRQDDGRLAPAGAAEDRSAGASSASGNRAPHRTGAASVATPMGRDVAIPDENDFEEETRRISSSSWQRHGYPNIRFRSEDELRRYLGPAGPGREWHHIVEKRLASRDGLPVEVIHNTDNIISLPVAVHRAINARMSSLSREHGNVVLRYWVERLPFEGQYNFGLDLIDRTLRELGHGPAQF